MQTVAVYSHILWLQKPIVSVTISYFRSHQAALLFPNFQGIASKFTNPLLFYAEWKGWRLLNKSYLKFLGQTIHELLHDRRARIISNCSRYDWHQNFQAPYFTSCFSAFLAVYPQINYPPSGDYTCEKFFRIWSETSCIFSEILPVSALEVFSYII